MENSMVENVRLSRTYLDDPHITKNAHLDASSLCCPPGKDMSRSREDEIFLRRWRKGFFVFYGATALLLGGLAVISSRSETLAGATAPNSQA
jgi:hypothetical protein